MRFRPGVWLAIAIGMCLLFAWTIGRRAKAKGRSGVLHGLNALVDPIGAELHLKQLRRKGPTDRTIDRGSSKQPD